MSLKYAPLNRVIMERAIGREPVHVFLEWEGRHINTTGVVTDEKRLEWAYHDARRLRLLNIAVAKALDILQTHKCSLSLSVNSNGLNWIKITFDGYALRHSIGGVWPYTDRPLAALHELCSKFSVNMIFGENLTRFMFDFKGWCIGEVEIDDGGC